MKIDTISLIKKLSPDPKKVQAFVDLLIKNNPHLNKDQIADIIVNRYAKISGLQGGATALPGAIPGLGTIIEISLDTASISADTALFIRNQTIVVYALGYLYGINGREQLIEDTLLCIGVSVGAISIKYGAINIVKKVAEKQVKKKISSKVLAAINKKVGITILTKYGTKRGGIALAKAIPLGIGVIIGGGFNYFSIKGFGKAAKSVMKGKYGNPGANRQMIIEGV